MTHQLVIGDVVKILDQRDMQRARRIDLTVTSPPYNLDIDYQGAPDSLIYQEYLGWSFTWLQTLWYCTALGGRLCLNIPLDTNKGGARPIYSDLLGIARQIGWNYKSTIVWNEGNISRRTAWGSWRSASAPNLIAPVEMIVVLYKGSAWKRERPEGVPACHIDRQTFLDSTLALWEFPGEKKAKNNHPAPFPEELPRRCVELFSFPGDLVCDPFVGSGTTGVVCQDRDFLGIDVSSDYVCAAMARLLCANLQVTMETFHADDLLQPSVPVL